MKRYNFLFYLLVFSSVFIHTACSHKSQRRVHQTNLHLQLGSQFLSAGNYPAAFRQLTRAKDLHPNDPVVHNLLALTYTARNKFQLAETYFKRALQLDPQYSEARNNLGRLYIRLKRYPSAIREIKKAMEDLKYHSPEKSHVNLGIVYYVTDQLHLAEKNFLQALELNNKYCPGYIFHGKTLLKQRKFQQASTTFDEAIKVCDNFDEPFYYSGLSHWHAGSKAKAKVRFENLLTIYPQTKYRNKTQIYLNKYFAENKTAPQNAY